MNKLGLKIKDKLEGPVKTFILFVYSRCFINFFYLSNTACPVKIITNFLLKLFFINQYHEINPNLFTYSRIVVRLLTNWSLSNKKNIPHTSIGQFLLFIE